MRRSIEEDFAKKLINYKTSQSGHEYRLFGHTMVTFEQLSENINEDTCVRLTAKHHHFSEHLQKWLCIEELEEFWTNGCVDITEYLGVCQE